ncbi:MAG: MFS transporter [Bacillota bacterium]|nr:MFS transporter [Bacillota bacterium]
MSYIQKGTAEFKNANIALFAGGFNTFAILYCTQPLMPSLSKQFNISPTAASLSLSVTTITLALSLLIFGSLSEVWGRKIVMSFSLVSASLLVLLTAFAPNFHSLLLFRMLQGLALAGLPAIAMAYIGEEIDPKSLGVAMGLYISGNSIGGMSGRIIIGTITDLINWRAALGSIGLIGLAFSVFFCIKLPESKHFTPRKMELSKLLKSMGNHLKNPKLLCLYAIGFFIMGSFVSLYNFIGYQLIAPPYLLSPTLVSFIFIIYIIGTFSSTYMGRLADYYGHYNVLWVIIFVMASGALITLNINLIMKIVGICIFTFGFFGSHSVVSSWIGKIATHDKSQASSLYLFFYYVGSSIGGTAGGTFWSSFGWGGVIGMISCFLILAILFSLYVSTITKTVKY